MAVACLGPVSCHSGNTNTLTARSKAERRPRRCFLRAVTFEGLTGARSGLALLGRTRQIRERLATDGCCTPLPTPPFHLPRVRPVSRRQPICSSTPGVKPALTDLAKQYFKCPQWGDTVGFVQLPICQHLCLCTSPPA